MTIEIQNKSAQPQQTITFTTQGAIQQWVVGVSYFKLSFGDDDHHINTASVSLSPSLTSSTSITVNVHAQLQDDSGNTINCSASQIGVVAMAITGTNDPKTTMANKTGIASGQESGGINLPGQSGFSVLTSFQSGFDLQYSADHHVEGANATAGTAVNGNLGFITARASLYDESGNRNSVATIDGGLVASINTSPGFALATVTAQQSGGRTVNFPQMNTVGSAIAMIQSWSVQYQHQDDHHVKTIGAGTSGWTLSGNNVILNDAQAFISDDSGHHQDDGVSNVSLLIVAIPA